MHKCDNFLLIIKHEVTLTYESQSFNNNNNQKKNLVRTLIIIIIVISFEFERTLVHM